MTQHQARIVPATSGGVRGVALVMCAALSLFIARPSAEAAQPRDPAQGLDRTEGLTPQEIQRLFDAYAVVQAQEQMGLSEEQFGPFVTRLKALQDTRRQIQQRRERLLRDLGLLTNGPAGGDDADLKARYDEYTRFEAAAVNDVRQALDAVDQVLTLRQRVRFRIFGEQMERRKLELLLRARQARAAQRRNPGLP